eukprot:CAMPEP_0183460530 /NCGR_PEP_ID=MMETSP0370-20130417/137787_1 /TAXON_ID=268820 /ORGANISM="Peridinium aciculiferum, Strain PAER-2" /LENGTH=118 /DNA_ID=CAMNT_0025652425 /DNA_START=31 /DNA_END=383 /DNA_ORIENTATION=-
MTVATFLGHGLRGRRQSALIFGKSSKPFWIRRRRVAAYPSKMAANKIFKSNVATKNATASAPEVARCGEEVSAMTQGEARSITIWTTTKVEKGIPQNPILRASEWLKECTPRKGTTGL